MINVSSEFRRALYNSNKKFLAIANITLADGTTLVAENDKIMENGIQFEDAVGSDESFSALGGVVINGLTLVLNNIYEDFSDYDFTDAKITRTRIGLQLSQNIEYINKGTYTVEDAIYNGATITLSCLDNMHKFDVPYSNSTLVYPASLDTIVRDLCTVCGVNLATSSLNFPRKDFVINERPSDEAITCREVLSWCATIAGCFARCNTDGELELKWFNTDSFGTVAETLDGGRFDNYDPNVYVTGDTADGGTFNPWNTGDAYNGGTFNPWNTGDAYDGGSFDYTNIHIINSLYSQNIAVDDVVITQIQAEVKVKADTGDAVVTYSEGQPGYTIKISGNEFINETNAQGIVTYLGNQIIGTTFRKANVSHASDPTIEAGDCAFVYDRKGNRYDILITRTNFTVGSAQTTVCGADTPARNSATRYTEQTKSYVEVRQQLIEQKTEWEEAVEDLEDQIANADGMYETQVQQTGGGVITYMHNKPLLAESDIQIMISDVGVTVTANGTSSSPTWYGLTVDGQFIASILNTIGVNADWIHSGTLKLGGANNVNGLLEVYNANNVKIGKWDKDGADITGKLTMASDNTTVNLGYDYTFFAVTNFNYLIKGEIENMSFRAFDTNDKLMSVWSVQDVPSYPMMENAIVTVRDSVFRDIFIATEVNSLDEIPTGGSISNYGKYVTERVRKDGTDYLSYYLGFSKGLYHWNIRLGSSGIEIKQTNNSIVLNRTNGIQMAGGSGGVLSIKDTAAIKISSNLKIWEFTDNGSFLIGHTNSTGTWAMGDNNWGTSTLQAKTGMLLGSSDLDIRCYSSGTLKTQFHANGTNNEITIEAGNAYFSVHNGAFAIHPYGKNSTSYSLRVTGGTLMYGSSSVAMNSTSSIRYKHNIESLHDDILDPHRLYNLEPKQFRYNLDVPLQYPDMYGNTLPGFIAEDVADVYPSAVIHHPEHPDDIESWDERRIIPPMLSLIQEQHEQIEQLTERVNQLERLVNQLLEERTNA